MSTTLGTFLAQARMAAGYAQQAEFASELGVKQQTISRWERGLSRPRAEQVPEIAAALGIDADTLRSAAGYAAPSSPQLSLDRPWPVDALPPETFERFCTEFVTLLHGDDAQVHPYGTQGHTQLGIDIDVVHTDGTRTTYQCKRHASFGPKKVAAAVAAQTTPADRKVILLSSSASPQAREEIKKHASWQLLDREDISRRARLELAKRAQIQLVDTFFVGQRMALLGEPELSPWQVPEQFFAGQTEPSRGFSHGWTLQGREKELNAIVTFATTATPSILMLIGNGGTGKSRLLKAFADRLAAFNPRPSIYFLSREPLKMKDLEALGSKPKLLVCDDAHDREDLALLADYVANPGNRSRLILALRTYGIPHVLQQTRALCLAEISRIELQTLPKADSEQLAKQALEHFGAPAELSSRLSVYTRDCPLATVIAAQILANDKSLPEFLIDEDTFRTELLRRLVASTVEGISSKLDAEAVHLALAAIALLQPIKEDDPELHDAIAAVAGITTHEVARIVKRLREAGVLYKRGSSSRIVPDLLGDFIVEERCISATGQSTGFAPNVFDEAPNAYAEHILVNFGRLDWRKSNGDTSNSRLLDELWSRLNYQDKYVNPHLRAAAAAAYYQPRQALAFVRRMLREGRADNMLADILRHVAYSHDHLLEACEILWELGRDDDKPQSQEPSHGIRVLKELASPELYKPFDFMSQVVDFGLSLIPYDDSWTGIHNPLEILCGALETEGHSSSATHQAIMLTPFIVEQPSVASIRKKIIDACIALLSHAETRRALAAAGALGSALKAPHGLLGATAPKNTVTEWEVEFAETLNAIDAELDRVDVAPVVIVKLAVSTGWYSSYGTGMLKKLAGRILSRLDTTLALRTTRLLVDGWGHLSGQIGIGRFEGHTKELDTLAQEILSSTSDPEEAYRFVEGLLPAVLQDNESAPHALIDRIISHSAEYAKELLQAVVQGESTASSRYAGRALAALLREQHELALVIAGNAADRGDARLLPVVAEAYAGYKPLSPYTPLDLRVLRSITSSDQPGVRVWAPHITRQVAQTDTDLAIELTISADFGDSQQFARDYLMWIAGDLRTPFDGIGESSIKAILQKLLLLPRIDDHWIQEFIKKSLHHYPEVVVELLVSRVEIARERSDWSYSPVPWASGLRGDWGLMRQQGASQRVRHLFDWALVQEQSGESVLPWFGDLVRTLCTFNSSDFVEFLRQWISSSGREGFALVISLARQSPQSFVFEQHEFVIWMMRLARSHGTGVLRKLVSALYCAAVSGSRSGVVGEPFPQDIKLRDQATEVLSALTRQDPAYELYSDLQRHAIQSIERQEEEGRMIAEMDG
ncbi:helix-turn-helix domain-containing protein [Stenotrophomonas maltophilia]|uniref:helix-turn-helix domain-containing protein n=1 Tax=Stenotrophomonas TaxID=40323 RepID=UPI0015DDC6AC|nr:helix-turn-helix domain-containing protein [Stenotrophomonas maltophilia]MBA0227654.1 helix-turn-helix domain-containing protein [Stenotrophomonas maltophilia]MBA0368695.1 helix-turn-helix domain-containing protein [Stenotrophomonas maltophilia]MBA0402941.1 helix-turn-helix domain-containing protein [Stenotrophomonas maltophilia]MCF3521422.1 helix-turn-helix domain-containing protein [Stenotrophomonas maltophilia]